MYKGVDVPIQALKSKFETNLWTSFDCAFYGRVFRDEVFNRRPIPKVYVSNREYEEVLLSDLKDATCFFDVLPNRQFNFDYKVTVWVCFAINLEKLYSSVSERATEYAHEDVKNLIITSVFKPTELITGLEAFRAYDLVQATDNLQPYYLFRFVTDLNYLDKC